MLVGFNEKEAIQRMGSSSEEENEPYQGIDARLRHLLRVCFRLLSSFHLSPPFFYYYDRAIPFVEFWGLIASFKRKREDP